MRGIKFHKFPNRLSCRSGRSLNETETFALTSETQILEVPYARTGLFLNIFEKKKMLTNAWLPGCILTAQESCNHNVDLGYDMVHRRFITQTVGYCKWISLIITNGHRLFQSVVGSGACHSSPHCWVICVLNVNLGGNRRRMNNTTTRWQLKLNCCWRSIKKPGVVNRKNKKKIVCDDLAGSS